MNFGGTPMAMESPTSPAFQDLSLGRARGPTHRGERHKGQAGEGVAPQPGCH